MVNKVEEVDKRAGNLFITGWGGGLFAPGSGTMRGFKKVLEGGNKGRVIFRSGGEVLEQGK